MTRGRLVLIGGVAVIAIALFVFLRPGSEHVSKDLVKELADATTRRPAAESFEAADVTLAGVKMPAVRVKEPFSRLGWHFTVPDDALLKVNLGMEEPSWTMKGDGVKFLIGISDGKKFDELASLVVNPFGIAGDRQWHELTVDLSAYAGETVDLYFNTYSSAPGADDRNGDMPLWGSPRIILR